MASDPDEPQGLDLPTLRCALVRGVVAGLLLMPIGLIAPDWYVLAYATYSFAVMHFQTAGPDLLPFFAALLGLLAFPAALVEARGLKGKTTWDHLGAILLALVVSAAGLALIAVQARYVGVIQQEGFSKALAAGLDQVRELGRLLVEFPRDTPVLLLTFSLPFAVLTGARLHRLPAALLVIVSGFGSALLAGLLYLPIAPAEASGFVGATRVEVSKPLLVWAWSTLLGFVGLGLAVASLLADSIEQRLAGAEPEEAS